MGVQAAKNSPQGEQQKLGTGSSLGFPFSNCKNSTGLRGWRRRVFFPEIFAQSHLGHGAAEQE